MSLPIRTLIIIIIIIIKPFISKLGKGRVAVLCPHNIKRKQNLCPNSKVNTIHAIRSLDLINVAVKFS